MARANVSVEEDQNFRSRCEREQKAFDEWPSKWELILDEFKYNIINMIYKEFTNFYIHF